MSACPARRARPGARPPRRAVRLSAGRWSVPGAGDVRRGALRRPAADRGGLGPALGQDLGAGSAQAAGCRAGCAADAGDGAGPDPAYGRRDAGPAGSGAEAGAQRPGSARAVAGQARLPPGGRAGARAAAARSAEPCSKRCPATPHGWRRRWPKPAGSGPVSSRPWPMPGCWRPSRWSSDRTGRGLSPNAAASS